MYLKRHKESSESEEKGEEEERSGNLSLFLADEMTTFLHLE